MRLDECEQVRVGEFVRYTAALSDDRGEQAYQLLLVGEEGRLKETFGESDFDITSIRCCGMDPSSAPMSSRKNSSRAQRRSWG